MAEISFTEEGHIYRRGDGTIIPSATTILQNIFPPRFPYPPHAATRGRNGHRATQLSDEEDLDEEGLDPLTAGYLAGWKKFRQETGFVPTAIEKIVYNSVYGYAGTLDRTGTFPNHGTEIPDAKETQRSKPAVVDIKTGASVFWHPLQTAAYALCLDAPHDRYCVYLKDDGTYSMASHRNRKDAQVFLAAVTIYKIRKENGYEYRDSPGDHAGLRGDSPRSHNLCRGGTAGGHYRQ
jgi:hypothetical protein